MDKLDGRRSWQKVLDLVRRKGIGSYPYEELSEGEREAVRLVGGIKVIGNSEEGDPFIEKRFLEVFENVKEEKNVLCLERAGQSGQITDGKRLLRDGEKLQNEG